MTDFDRENLHYNYFRDYDPAIGRYVQSGPIRTERRHQYLQLRLGQSADPITGKAEWGFVAAPDGGIMGVHSLSQAAPIKNGNFSAENAKLTNVARYAEWQFIYTPATALPQKSKPP